MREYLAIAVTFPDLPDCVAFAATLPDAPRVAEWALAIHLEGLRAARETIPKKAVDEYFQEHAIPIFLSRIDYTGGLAVKP